MLTLKYYYVSNVISMQFHSIVTLYPWLQDFKKIVPFIFICSRLWHELAKYQSHEMSPTVSVGAVMLQF